MSVLLSGITFCAENTKVGEGSSATQPVIFAELRGEVFPVAKLIPSDRLYQERLEKNYKPIVNLMDVAENLADLLLVYATLDLLNEQRYGVTMEAYNKFVDNRMTFPALKARAEFALSNEGWV